MKQRWQNLAQREQQLIKAMAVLIAVFLFYILAWNPLNTNLEKAQAKLEKNGNLLTWVKANTAKFKGVKIQSKSAGSNATLTSIVNSTAKNWQVSVTRMQPKNDELQIWIDQVKFDDFLAWTEQLYLKQGVVINAADVSETDIPGLVKISRLTLAKG